MSPESNRNQSTRHCRSKRHAIDETERRRAKQVAFNQAHGIVPKGVVKRIKDIIDGIYNPDAANQELKAAQTRAKYQVMSEKDLAKEIKRVEKDMLSAARNLEFEKAAELRDRMHGLKKQLFGVDEHDE